MEVFVGCGCEFSWVVGLTFWWREVFVFGDEGGCLAGWG